MADSDGSPQRDNSHHRRSRSRSPVSPEWMGETPAERQERRLAEAAVLVGPPQPAQEPEPAEVTAPAAQAASPAAPSRGGGLRRAGSRDRSPIEPRRGPDRGPRHAANTGGSLGARTGRIAQGCRSRREKRGGRARGATAAPASCATASAGHAAAPSTPRKRGKDPARSTGASPAAAAAAVVGRESAKYLAHANPTHTHTSHPKPFPSKPFPLGRTRHVCSRRLSARRRASCCRGCKDSGTPGA